MANEFWVDLWAGWIAGAASVLAVQPVDTTLTRMQATRLAPGVDGSARAALRRVLAEGGARALWRGVAPMTAVIPMQNALLFAGYGAGERWASRRHKDAESSTTPSAGKAGYSNLLPVFVGGCVGGVLQSFVVSPFELVKIRQQASGGAVTLAVSTLAGNLGRVGLATRGLGATLLRDGVPHGVWFAAYEWSKRSMKDSSGKDSSSSASNDSAVQDTMVPVCAGAFAAAVAWGVGYPADLVKTRVQAAAAAGGAESGLVKTCAAMLRESNGDVLRAFYRGFDLKLLRAVPASAVSFFAYEEARRWLERE